MARTIVALVSLFTAAIAAAAQLTGTVTDAGTGRRLAGVRVELVEQHATTTTNAAGAFTLELRPGGGTLAVSLSGYHVQRLQLSTVPSKPLEVALAPLVPYGERIQVTATRAREGTDPVSLTNIPQEQVAENYWGQDPAMLLSSVAPGYFAYNDSGNGIGYSYFWIRGFNQAASRVTLNGAPLNDAESGELFFIDLADFLATAGDIQMQRGVFGLSGIAGAVDITTAPPLLSPSFDITSGFGSYRTRRTSVRWDSGLIDGRWAMTARYSKITTDGYRQQSWVDMWNYYLTLDRFGERDHLRLVLFGGPEHTHLAYDGIPKSVLDGGLTGNARHDRRTNPLTYPGETDTFTQPHFQLLHELAISPSTQLAQTFFVFTGDGYYDEYKAARTLAEYDLPDVTLPDGSTVTESDLVRRRQVTEWDAGWVPTLTHDDGPWTFTLRGELRFHSGRHFGEVKWAQFYPPEVAPDHRYYDYQVDKRSAALAVGVSYRPSDRLVLSAGLEGEQQRYELLHDKLKGVSFTDSYNFLMPRAGAVLHATTGIDLYANVARGMHEPAFRTIYDPEDYYGERVNLRPEDVWDWEAGVSVRQGSWRARANVFWMSFANEIVYAGRLDSSGVPVYGNGARSRHRGLELDASYEPTPWLAFDGTLSLSRNTFVRYHEYVDPETVNIYDGKKLAGYPDVLASLSARTSIGPVRLFATGRYVGLFYLDNTQDTSLQNPAFGVLDVGSKLSLPKRLVAALGLEKAEVELRVNNVLDRLYTAFGYVDDGARYIPAATRNFYAGLTLGL